MPCSIPQLEKEAELKRDDDKDELRHALEGHWMSRQHRGN